MPDEQQESPDPTQPDRLWFLRTQDAITYGPFTTDVLCNWARQGLVTQGYTLSVDKNTWQPAESMPDLGLEWNAVFPDGSVFGPFHLDAVSGLVERQTIPANATLKHRVTGETRLPPAPSVPPPPAERQPPPDQPESGATRTPVQEPRSESPPAQASRPVESAPLEPTVTVIPPEDSPDALHRRIREVEARCVEVVQAAGAKEAQLAERIRDLERQTGPSLQRRIERLRRGLARERTLHARTRTESTVRITTLEKSLLEKTEDDKFKKFLLAAKTHEMEEQDKRYRLLAKRSIEEQEKLTRRLATLEEARAQPALPGPSAPDETEVATLQNELQKAQTRYDELKASAEAKEAAHQDRIAQLQANARRLAETIAKHVRDPADPAVLRKELEAARAECESVRAQARENEAAVARRVTELEQELQRTASELKLRTQQAEARASEEAGPVDEREPATRIRHLEEKAKFAAAQVLELKAELKKERGLRAQQEAEFGQKEAQWQERIRILEQSAQDSTRLIEQSTQELARKKGETGPPSPASDGETERMRSELAERRQEAAQLQEELRRRGEELQKRSTELEAQKQAHLSTGEKLRREVEKQEAARAEIAKLRNELSAERVKSGPTQGWFLKSDDGHVFGPVPLRELKEWSAQCRVGPEHRVSTNKEKWIPAKDVPDLKMKWTARYPDGTSYGPVSICAMAYLVARGSVDRRSEVINLSTGQRCSAEDLLRPEVKAFVDYEN